MVKSHLSSKINLPFQMLLHKTNLFTKSLSTSTTLFLNPKNLNWRSQFKQNLLISQISTLLLQRHNWPQLLQPFNLPYKLNPSLFLQILHNIQTHPQISLNFFNWSVKNARFQPDLKSHCKITRILLQSNLVLQARPILDSLIQTYPPIQIVESLIIPCKSTYFDSQFLVFGSVIDCYCKKGLYFQALEVVLKTKSLLTTDYRLCVTVQSCNTLLNVLQEKNEIRVALCFFGYMLRNGVLANQLTWDLVARILCKDGRIESVVRIIDMGVYDVLIYNLVIEFYSERGDFEVALKLLDKMCKRELDTGFDTYASILEGACQHENSKVISLALDSMVEKGFISKVMSKYDSVVQKLLGMRKTCSANMLFRRAFEENILLEDDTYAWMLRVLSEEGRAKDAIGIFRLMEQKGVKVKNISYDAFTDVLCLENPSEEVNRLLIDMISRGFIPSSLNLSKYITSQCDNARWEEAEELVNLCLEKSIFPEASCFCSLVKHYCKNKRIDLAIALHEKMEGNDRALDVSTYNVLLDRLTRRRMVEEAERVFGYMERKDLLSSESFSIIITALCQENEMRKAMKLHDEMLKLELKPDRRSYKRLISRFK